MLLTTVLVYESAMRLVIFTNKLLLILGRQCASTNGENPPDVLEGRTMNQFFFTSGRSSSDTVVPDEVCGRRLIIALSFFRCWMLAASTVSRKNWQTP